MNKPLIHIDNLEEHVCAAGSVLYADGALITPGARDALARRRIRVVSGPRPQDDPCRNGADAACAGCPACGATPAAGRDGLASDQKCSGQPLDENLLIGVAALIRKEHGITDPVQLRDMTLSVVKTLQETVRQGA